MKVSVDGAPSGHLVQPRAEYQFDIDYSHLSADPGPR